MEDENQGGDRGSSGRKETKEPKAQQRRRLPIHHPEQRQAGRGATSAAIVISLLAVVGAGLYLSWNQDVALELLAWLEAAPTHLQVTVFFLLYVVASLPMMLGCIILNITAGLLQEREREGERKRGEGVGEKERKGKRGKRGRRERGRENEREG